jgi:hypothetical protein
MVSVLVSVADPAPSNSLLLKQLELEAEVGIGRFTSVFTKKIYAFSPMNASTFALLLTFPNELINYPLTEGFTETFTEDFLAHARM